MKIINDDSHDRLVGSAHIAYPTSASYVKLQHWITHFDKMHLKIVEETEWDAARELGYVIQAAQTWEFFFNALA